MFATLRNTGFIKLLWGFMGLYLLNISVDPADPNPNHFKEDLSINDQESIVEIVIEKVLGYENAIAEYDDNDTEDHNKRSNLKIDIVIPSFSELEKNTVLTHIPRAKFHNYNCFLTSEFLDLDTPPPKV